MKICIERERKGGEGGRKEGRKEEGRRKEVKREGERDGRAKE